MPEARLEDSGSGLAPASDGWFVVNAGSATWWASRAFGSACEFDSQEFAFPQLGLRVHVLEPGEPNGLYHSESELAARYGASAEEEATNPQQAYARFGEHGRGRPSCWDRLPWA